MIATGAQIAAGRALLRWTRSDLAKAAGLHKNSIAYWEKRDAIETGQYRSPIACRRIAAALNQAGVEIFVDPAPGVRFVPK